ncbi:MAG TPA: biotin/lipoyl-containing protein [Ramlibacter sp.]|nr:biotin/lipoyl-containing protein [Ramlibacter sp.]
MALQLGDLRRLVRHLQSSEVTCFEYEGPQFALRLVCARSPGAPRSAERTAAVHVAPPPVQALASAALVKSPGIGRFFLQHPLGDRPPIREGGQVEAGQILAFLRVGQVLTAVLADRAGVVVRRRVEEGALVGYGETLFELS